MASTVQVTAMKIGPGAAVSRTFSDVTDLVYDFDQKTITVVTRDNVNTIIDIDAAATITHTISAKQHTVAIS